MSRESCTHCLKPVSLCYCHLIEAEGACIDLVILQHPREAKHPLNSARIVELGIKNCQLWVGEDFSEHQQLQALLDTKSCYLLFPASNARACREVLSETTPEVVIILDGTWRKARRIYHCNPALQKLPAITLNDTARSNYRIRKAPGDEALSTVEASVTLLREINLQTDSHASLLKAFNWMIDQQIKCMGEDTWRKNYAGRDR
ncbi:tRNA-uridine aminocarboxypropyltransferase [Endozoicomonas atrinae]|uniref:tRNA-uridine aminocarboxypropyltransferase n=1 Tax=Endozoicomonas atrinae TaxID=1333660 RepID=UPI003B00A750